MKHSLFRKAHLGGYCLNQSSVNKCPVDPSKMLGNQQVSKLWASQLMPDVFWVELLIEPRFYATAHAICECRPYWKKRTLRDKRECVPTVHHFH